MSDENSGSEPTQPRTKLEMVCGAVIILVSVGALAWSLDKVLDHYPVQEERRVTTQQQGKGKEADATTTQVQPANDRSTAVVAVMAPVAAGFLALVGLYFGVLSVAANRAKQAEAVTTANQTAAKATETVGEVARQQSQFVHMAGAMEPEQYRRLAAEAERLDTQQQPPPNG